MSQLLLKRPHLTSSKLSVKHIGTDNSQFASSEKHDEDGLASSMFRLWLVGLYTVFCVAPWRLRCDIVLLLFGSKYASAECWIHFTARFRGVHAFGYNSAKSEPIIPTFQARGRRWKMLCQLHEAGYVKRRSCCAHWTEAGCRHSAGQVLTYIVQQYRDWCQTSKYIVWTEFCSTLAASGAASGEVLHASGQKHHRGV